MQATKMVLGAELPVQPNTWVSAGDYKLFWLGPDEWLVISPPGQETELEKKLRDALDGIFSSVTDVSSGQTILRISGDKARAVLQKGCSFDLHPSMFKQGDCAQTLLAKAGMLISYGDDAPTFELVVRRSFSDYVGLWLLDATGEFLG
jgi:sarcosine oxidase subunit gamma